jgi:hypothetical protein
MHPNIIDLTNCIFGKWTVIERGPNSKGRSARWWCLCVGSQRNQSHERQPERYRFSFLV